ncbi:MAG: hypothetical protein ABL964_13515 [Steroidobacteraceae bacterium]
MTSLPVAEPLSLSDALAQEFPSIESLSISYLQSTPGDGYPGTSVSWDPSKGDRLECSNSACLKGGVAIAALLSPIVATAQAKAVRKKPCTGQERMANGDFRPCANQFMIAVELRYTVA